jgi:hypothetical protein
MQYQQTHKCYICSGVVFQCEFNGDVCIVIGVTIYSNTGKCCGGATAGFGLGLHSLVSMYILDSGSLPLHYLILTLPPPYGLCPGSWTLPTW